MLRHARDRARGAPARRQAPAPASHLLILARGGGRDLRARRPGRASEGGAPPRSSRCCWSRGLLLLYPALLTLADVLGADFDELPGRRVRVDLAARRGARRSRPAVRARLGDLRADRARSRWASRCWRSCDWVFDADRPTPFRWLLLLRRDRARARLARAARGGAAALRAAGQRRRAGDPRDRPDRRSCRRVSAVLSPFGGAGGRAAARRAGSSSLLAAGCGLIAYGAVDRAPGAGLARRREPRRLRRSRRRRAATRRCYWWPLLLILARRRHDGRRPAPARAAAARAAAPTRARRRPAARSASGSSDEPRA